MNQQQATNFQSLLDPHLRQMLDNYASSDANATLDMFNKLKSVLGWDDLPNYFVEELNSFSNHPSPELRKELEKKFGKENVDKILTLLEGA